MRFLGDDGEGARDQEFQGTKQAGACRCAAEYWRPESR